MNLHKEPFYNEETFAWIDACLIGTAAAPERERFEEKMAADPAFRAVVEEHKMLVHGIEKHAMAQKMEDFHHEVEAKPAIKRNYFRYAAAATILVVIGLSAWQLFFAPSPAEKLYAEVFTPDPGLPTTMSRSDNYLFFEGMVSYKRQNYKGAISQWQGLYVQNPDNDTLTYFLGAAYMARGDVQNAQNFLMETRKDPKSVFYEETLYYLALSQLKENKTRQALETLSESQWGKNKALRDKINQLE